MACSDLLPGVGAEAYARVAGVSAVRLAAGEQLLAHGDAADCLYVVAQGEVEVVLDVDGRGAQQLSRLGAGAVVGEIGLLAGDTRSATVRAVDACELVAVPADAVRQLLGEHPAAAEALARRATERLRRTQLIAHFTALFGPLDPAVLATIEELMEWVALPAGALLFAQGDDSDASAYLVATGRLRAFHETVDGVSVEVGEIGRAELVGEMSLLDGQPRGASVYAVRDCQLMRFSPAAYTELLRRYPRVGLEVAQMALRRARDHGHRSRQRLSLVLVPASPGVDLRAFADALVGALGPGARRVGSAEIDAELERGGIAQIGDDDVGALRLAYHLEEMEERHRFLVYEIDDGWSPWSRRALRWADQVLLVADAGAAPEPAALEQELWSLVSRQQHPRVSLALLHPPDVRLPSGTRAWLDGRQLASHHHLRRGDTEHLARLARLVAGSGTSLVLGGGGARGFAHLGVLDVLEQQGRPVDMVGGSSIGAIMAAGPAMGWSVGEFRGRALEAFRKLLDYTLPASSLLRGERISRKLHATFGDVDIADLWLPFFAVSTNLTRAEVHVHDRGPLVRVLRASIAIPGVLPPVPEGGDLLVDGGVLDNVPVEEMRRRNPTGSVVAVDVAPVEGPSAGHDYGLSLRGVSAFLARRRGGGGPPSLLATMVRAGLVASVRDRHRVVREEVADLYLDVGVEGGASLDFSAAAQIADSAAAAVRPVLRQWTQDEPGGPRGYVRVDAPRSSSPPTARRRQRRGGVLLLTLRDLQHRAARFGAVVLGTAVVLTLLFLMTGLTEQFHREPRDTVAALGATAWLVRDGASGAFTSAATMPAETAALVQGAAGSPVVIARHSITEGPTHTDVVVVGYVAGGLGEPALADGRLPAGAGEITVDDSSGLALDDTALLGDQRYEVVGRTDRTTMFAGMPLVFMPLDAAQALLYRGQPLATAVLLDGQPVAVPEGFAVLEPGAVAKDAMRPLERSISSVNLIRMLLWLVAALIIGTMTYLSALERRRDVAVLKAVGASTRQLAASIALQGALVALVAALAASLLQVVVVPVFPLEVSVPARALWQLPLVAVLVALAAGSVGLRQAVRTDPALAFSGPGS